MGIEESLPVRNDGNQGNSVFSFDNRSPQFQQLTKRFIITPTASPNSSQTSPILTLHEKLSNNKFLLRIIASNDRQQLKRTQQVILAKLASLSNRCYTDSITKISQYMTKSEKNYCNSIHKCYIMFELGEYLTLSEYLVRKIERGNGSTMQNVYEGLCRGLGNLLEGLRWLRYFKHPHENLSLQQIYVRQSDNNYLLSDPWLAYIFTDRQTKDAFSFYSPQKIKKSRNQIDSYDPYVSDVFSLGIIGLKAAKMLETRTLYGENINISRFFSRAQKKIELEGLHQVVGSLHHSQLRQIISMMLGSISERSELLNRKNIQTFPALQNNLSPSHSSQIGYEPRRLGGKKNSNSKISVLRRSFDRNEEPPYKQFQKMNNSINFTYTPSQPNHSRSLSNQNLQSTTPIPSNFQINPSLSKSVSYQNGQVYVPSLPQTHQYPYHHRPYSYQRNLPQLGKQHDFSRKLISDSRDNILNSSMKSQHSNQQHKINFITRNPSKNQIAGENSHSINKSLRNHENAPIMLIANTPKQSSLPLLMKDQQKSNKSLKTQILTYSHSQPSLNSEPTNKFQSAYNKQLLNQEKNVMIAESVPVQSIIFVRKKPEKIQEGIIQKDLSQQSLVKSVQSSEYKSEHELQIQHNYQKKLFDELKLLQSKVAQFINQESSSPPETSQQQDPQKPNIIIEQSQNPLTESEKRLFTRQTDEKQNIVESQIVSVAVPPPNSSQFDFLRQNNYSGKNHQPTHHSDLSESEIHEGLSDSQLYDKLSLGQDGPSSRQNSEANQEEIQQQMKKQEKKPNDKVPENMIYEPAVISSMPTSNKLVYNMTIPEEEASDFSESEISSINSSRHKENEESSRRKKKSVPIGEYTEESYENGGRYEGYKLNNKRHGQGIFYYKDGGYYKGRWRQNMMHGFGCLYYDNQKIAYQGEWYQDQFHGRGKVYNDRPQKLGEDEMFDYRNMNQAQAYWQYYTGYLNHDMKEFMGKMMLSNGQYYQGEFSGDMVDGKGKFYRKDGQVIRGVWKQGILDRQF